jgi:hypothetical protein
MRDKNGKMIDEGDEVQMPDPTIIDMHEHEFVGTVVGFKPDGLVTVADQDGNCFDVEADRVEVL